MTFAIGCALLVLNILIFATFYYEREKRLNTLRRSASRSLQKKDQSFPSPGLQQNQSSSTPTNSSSLKRRKENGGVCVSGSGGIIGTSSFYNIDRSTRSSNEPRTSSSCAFGDLHLSTYVSVDEEPCGSTGESATVGEVSYVNYPIKKYSERPASSSMAVGTIHRIGSSSTSGNRQRRAINELPIPIDMSESLTNDPNFSAQSSPYRALEMGTTFVGIEASSYRQDHHHHCHQQEMSQRSSQQYSRHYQNPHQAHIQQQQKEEQQEDNSSIDDGQSSH